MNIADGILIAVLIVLVVALFAVSYMRKRKYNNELGQMRSELKNGDKVMTDTGVVGEVVDSYTEDEYKYFVIKTGRGNNIGYFTVHANAIYYVFNKDAQEKPKKENFNSKSTQTNENANPENTNSENENVTSETEVQKPKRKTTRKKK